MRQGKSIKSTAFTVIAAFLLFLTTSQVFAEQASNQEIENVCHNWLTSQLLIRGNWAGSQTPAIINYEEIPYEGTTVARVYHISPKGFILVSTYKDLMPVKLYSDVSDWTSDQEQGVISLMSELYREKAEIVDRTVGLASKSNGGYSDLWEKLALPEKDFIEKVVNPNKLAVDEYGPLLQSSWHQRAPYNNLCPIGDGGDRTVVGCVATAYSQILNYWQWPDYGRYYYSYTWEGDNSCGGSTPSQVLGADYSDAYDWSSMLDSCDNGCAPADSAALAELCYEVGVLLDMDYGVCGSGASVSAALKQFPQYLKYKNTLLREDRIDYDLAGWFNLIKDEVNLDRPIAYRINMHLIVCDGWREQIPGMYEYHMNYGWGNEFTAWYVLDSLYCGWVDGDICPPDEDYLVLGIEPEIGPEIYPYGYYEFELSGNGDGIWNAGEEVGLYIHTRNIGLDAASVSGFVSIDDPYVTLIDSTMTFYKPLVYGDFDTSGAITMSISPDCPDPYIAEMEVTIMADGGWTTVNNILLHIGSTAGLSEDFETENPYWISRQYTPCFHDEWHADTYRYHGGTQSAKAGGPGSINYKNSSDGVLISPPFLLPDSATLSFWYYSDIEADDSAWDGAMVMLSHGTSQGFLIQPVDGYTYRVHDNPACPVDAGWPCFSGTRDWTQVTFDLSDYSGVVQLVFRFFSDGWVTQEGWYIDDVSVTGVETYICGDVDESGAVNILDITNIIAYLYQGGSAPDPLWVGDVNNDDTINLLDITYLIAYIYQGGPPPACT